MKPKDKYPYGTQTEKLIMETEEKTIKIFFKRKPSKKSPAVRLA